jgi:hypothetical protein
MISRAWSCLGQWSLPSISSHALTFFSSISASHVSSFSRFSIFRDLHSGSFMMAIAIFFSRLLCDFHGIYCYLMTIRIRFGSDRDKSKTLPRSGGEELISRGGISIKLFHHLSVVFSSHGEDAFMML